MELNITGFGEERSEMDYAGVSDLIKVLHFFNFYSSLNYEMFFFVNFLVNRLVNWVSRSN